VARLLYIYTNIPLGSKVSLLAFFLTLALLAVSFLCENVISLKRIIMRAQLKNLTILVGWINFFWM
jgi:hypothetical protein